jgi:hypothetical protein
MMFPPGPADGRRHDERYAPRELPIIVCSAYGIRRGAEMARGMTLKQIQPYASDTVTDEVLKNMDAEFAALSTKGK